MRLMRRLAGLLCALPAAVLISVDPAYGQSSGSAADAGLQILQGLSPDQVGSLSRQLGGTNGTQNSQSMRQQPLVEEQQSLMLQQQREQMSEQRKQRAEQDRLNPYLQGDDWIVVTIDWLPLVGGNQVSAAQPGPLGALAGAAGNQQQNILGNLASSIAANQAPAGSESSGGSGTPASVGAAGAAASATPQPQGVTAGGYTLLPPNCSGQPNCDSSLPSQLELTDEARRQRQVLIDLIRSKSPFQLSHDGLLLLPGFSPIPLAGLTEQLATLRLGQEPALRDLFIRVTKLPLTKVGPTALKPFGYDLFDRPISTFAPSTNVPVPAGYVIGAGDELDVQLYG
jgi:hypothetical protein